jgi:hypothetical protein
MGEMVAHGAGREDTAYRNGTRVSARDHSRLSGVQYGRILVAATVETDFSGLCPDSLDRRYEAQQTRARTFSLCPSRKFHAAHCGSLIFKTNRILNRLAAVPESDEHWNLAESRQRISHYPVGEACQSCGLGAGAESWAAAHILVGRCRPRAFIGASQFAASTTPFVTYSNKLIIKPPPSHRQTRVPN